MEESEILSWIRLPSYSSVSPRAVFFSFFFFLAGFLWLCLGFLRDEKEGKKSSLVSALQKQHPEPNCHPTWIKSPWVMAAELLTWCLTLSRGVGGVGGGAEGKGIRAPGLNKTSRSASPEPCKSHFVFPCQLYSWADSEVSPSFLLIHCCIMHWGKKDNLSQCFAYLRRPPPLQVLLDVVLNKRLVRPWRLGDCAGFLGTVHTNFISTERAVVMYFPRY